MLHLDHLALAGHVALVRPLRDHAVQPQALEAVEPVLGHRGVVGPRREQDDGLADRQSLGRLGANDRLQPRAALVERCRAKVAAVLCE
jgi:hypothetical protein